jgi:hypothetical protein
MKDTKASLVHSSPPQGNGRSRSARARGPLGWWYRLTAPAEPPENATLSERELARRGRLTSATLLVVILLVLAAYPVAFLGPSRVLAFVLLIPLTIDVTALFFNRAGKIGIAGILVVVGIEVGIGLSIVGPALAGGLTTYMLPQFDLLVQADFVAVTLLRPRSVIWLVGFHILATVTAITFLPHSAEFSSMLAVNGYEVYLRIITLQIIVAFVTYLWVTGAQQAIQRADRAEEIAALEQREIERQQHEIEQKQLLDIGIQQILQTHVQVANGNFSARAPLGRENVLWQIAYSLNNLLARLQEYHQMQDQVQRNRAAIAYLVQAIQQAKRKGVPLQVERTGTPVDALILELSTRSISENRQGNGSMASPIPRRWQMPK